MRKLIDPNSSCGFCGGYDLGTRCESCGAGSDNYDATGGEQGWIMKSKLNELRLDAGIARIENQQWLCVLDKETGMMIDPMIGLEKFAELIVAECSRVIVKGGYWSGGPLGPKRQCTPPEIAQMIRQHFGVEE
jgi:hypothetical protein